ncbi:MAG: C40 family peptidase, partial [Stellaceae bacterium]
MSDPTARAVVRAAVAPLLVAPGASSVQASQRLAGHRVEVIETQGDWRRVRGADGYEGWVHAGYLSGLPGGSPPPAGEAVRISLGCEVREPGGRRRALPLGAYLAPDETVEAGDAVSEADTAIRFPPTAAAITRSALQFFGGTSYQWGGITPWGADCSGFVQTVCWLHGILLPRDAWQQSECGAPGAEELNALQPGELAFFSDREDLKITHVGLGIGDGRMAHVAIGRGGFAVERLFYEQDAYVGKLRKRFRFARRL